MSRSLALCAATVACWLFLGASAHAAGVAGDFFVIDGPFAGTPLKSASEPAGFVSRHSNPFEARGFVRPPNDQCPYYHFEGRIGGKKIKKSDCLRLGTYGYSQQFLIEMGAAIKDEARVKGAAKPLKSARENLNDAFDELKKALAAGKITQGAFDNLQELLEEALKLDKEAKGELKEGNDKKAQKLIEKALNRKHAVVDGVPITVTLLQPPQLAPLDAVFQAAASQTVYTENILANPDGRNLQYAWTLVELNDPTCIDFRRNTPNANQAIWHHPNSQCDHNLEGPNGHQGIVGVVVNDIKFSCTAIYFGSNTGTSTSAPVCSQTGE
jgi:hypothetical protein